MTDDRTLEAETQRPYIYISDPATGTRLACQLFWNMPKKDKWMYFPKRTGLFMLVLLIHQGESADLAE